MVKSFVFGLMWHHKSSRSGREQEAERPIRQLFAIELENMTQLNKYNQTRNSTMKVLIIYDDFYSAVKANATLQHSARKAGVVEQLNVRPWRVDLFKFPPTSDEALTEALDAHLIVFAGHGAQSLPFWLERWLEQWTKYRQVKNAALAVVHAGRPKTLSLGSTKSDLSQFARRHDLNVIFDDEIASMPSSIGKMTSSGDDHLHEHELSMSPSLPQTLDIRTRDAYRGWSTTGLPSRS